MPKLIPSNKFLADAQRFARNSVLRGTLAKVLLQLEANPAQPGLHIERIVNDPSAWSARVDSRYRLSFEPGARHENGFPDWRSPILLLRVLDHDDLYRMPR